MIYPSGMQIRNKKKSTRWTFLQEKKYKRIHSADRHVVNGQGTDQWVCKYGRICEPRSQWCVMKSLTATGRNEPL